MSLAYLEEYLDALAAVSQQVQRSVNRLAQLDNYGPDGRTKLIGALHQLQSSPASPEACTAVQTALLEEIDRSAEKKAVADHLVHTLSQQAQLLEDDLQGFQEELKMAKEDVPAPMNKGQKRGECICGGRGRGEMVGCENPNCPLEWFHLSCVGLTKVPSGKWYCPECLRP